MDNQGNIHNVEKCKSLHETSDRSQRVCLSKDR